MLRVRSSLCNVKDFIQLFKPPSYLYDNSVFLTLYPIDRLLFPKVIPNRDIIYQLYTSNNPTTPQILEPGNDVSLLASNMCFSRPTVIYFHGFLEGTNYGSAKIIHDAYMQCPDQHNVILVNAQLLAAGPWYLVARRNTRAVGKYTASFIDYLVTKGLKLDKLHLVGHSLGGHMAGFTGQYVKSGKVARITALDPANQSFKRASPTSRLDKSNAQFVDVIHTDCHRFGFERSIGHADFYPNGGSKQPGTNLKEVYERNGSIMEMVFCSHWRSVYFYAESVIKPRSFLSKQADSWSDYLKGKYSNDVTCMGYGVDKTARGNYYLTTNKCKPYSL